VGHRQPDLWAWQYFLWYLILFPLILPRLRIDLKWGIIYAAVWAGTQALWLEGAYRLEFLGEDMFLGLWIRSLLWVVGNAWVLAGVMNGYRSSLNSLAKPIIEGLVH
jgi:phosphatidylinositol glycan class M